MKTWDEINVSEKLSFQDFFTLFADKLPLLEEEKKDLSSYYQMYEAFLTAGVNPSDSWVTVRNIFAIKNKQIGDRIKNNAITL